jgi:hypothetical protein
VGLNYAQGEIEFNLFPLIDTGSDPFAVIFNISALIANVCCPRNDLVSNPVQLLFFPHPTPFPDLTQLAITNIKGTYAILR